MGYSTGDFQLHMNINTGTEFGGSIYQKVCEDSDTSVKLAWTAGTNCTRFGTAVGSYCFHFCRGQQLWFSRSGLDSDSEAWCEAYIYIW